MSSTGSSHPSLCQFGVDPAPSFNCRLQPQTEQSRESGGVRALSELPRKEQDRKYSSYTVYRTSHCRRMESFQIAVPLSLLLTL